MILEITRNELLIKHPILKQFDQKYKYDEGKDKYSLIPPEWLKWLVDVFMVGYARHGKDNWKKVEYQRFEDALMRHLQAYRFGHMKNPEDNDVYHLAQIAFNALAILSIRLEKDNGLQ